MTELTVHPARDIAKPTPPFDAADGVNGHSHSHFPGHAHHHGPLHQHDHASLPALQTKRADPPRLSLMALSAGQRLIVALPVVAFLWLLTFWAMRDG